MSRGPTITTRAPTEAERDTRAALHRSPRWVLPLAHAAAVVGVIGEEATRRGSGAWAIVAMMAAAPLLVIGAVFIFHPRMRRSRALRDADVRRRTVEEIAVEASRVVEFAAEGDEAQPAFCFDVGEGKLLLLMGRRLRETEVVVPDDSNAVATFPSRQFVVVRLPASGKILALRARGGPLVPVRKDMFSNLGELGRRPCEICEGSLDDARAAITTLARGK